MKTVEEIAVESGASVYSVCKALIKFIELGLVKPDGPIDKALESLRLRMRMETERYRT